MRQADGGVSRARSGSRRPRGTRALLRGGWAPSGRAASAAAWRERVPSTPTAPGCHPRRPVNPHT